MPPAVYRADQVAELFDISEWAVYQAVRREEAPLGTMAIRVGRRVVWPRAAIDRLLGIGPEPAA